VDRNHSDHEEERGSQRIRELLSCLELGTKKAAGESQHCRGSQEKIEGSQKWRGGL